jgi:type II secretory pathway component HofQ
MLIVCLFVAGAARASEKPSPTPVPKKAASKKADGSKAIAVRAPHRSLAPGDRISLDVKDADIRDVIRTFASLAKINVVIDPEVKGSVTVRLNDVRWEDALDVILRSNGLGSVREDSLMRVGTPSRLMDAGDEQR